MRSSLTSSSSVTSSYDSNRIGSPQGQARNTGTSSSTRSSRPPSSDSKQPQRSAFGRSLPSAVALANSAAAAIAVPARPPQRRPAPAGGRLMEPLDNAPMPAGLRRPTTSSSTTNGSGIGDTSNSGDVGNDSMDMESSTLVSASIRPMSSAASRLNRLFAAVDEQSSLRSHGNAAITSGSSRDDDALNQHHHTHSHRAGASSRAMSLTTGSLPYITDNNGGNNDDDRCMTPSLAAAPRLRPVELAPSPPRIDPPTMSRRPPSSASLR
jgi:hypothetical protein